MSSISYPLSMPINKQIIITIECLQEAEDMFEVFHSDGVNEVYGLYDALERPVKLVKNDMDQPVLIEFDNSPLEPTKLNTSRTYDLTGI